MLLMIRGGFWKFVRNYQKSMDSSLRHGNYDVDLTNLDSNPHCSHGPTVLFKQKASLKNSKSKDLLFYGCSAYRNMKTCNFRLNASHAKKPLKRGDLEPPTKRRKLEYQRPESMCTTTTARFCKRCSRVLDEEEVHPHKEITTIDPRFPSQFLTPLSNNPGEAQYFFSPQTIKFFLNTVLDQKISHVLNVGCPRLHEELISRSTTFGVKSFLLDIDARFNRYFPRTSFACYNMFNHHFFSPSGRHDYMHFLSGVRPDNILVIMDPPFGGMVKLLAHNLRRVYADMDGECKIMWIFPYFMQQNILQEFPNISMLSYVVCYDNHKKFKEQTAKDSPVRIFTNLNQGLVKLPEEEGYWFCNACCKFSSQCDKHCDICGKCPSLNGKEWRHCSKCGICVKKEYLHCKKCRKCHSQPCLAI